MTTVTYGVVAGVARIELCLRYADSEAVFDREHEFHQRERIEAELVERLDVVGRARHEAAGAGPLDDAPPDAARRSRPGRVV